MLRLDRERMTLDVGSATRPLRFALWRSRRRKWVGVERRSHQVRLHFGRWHLTVGRFVWLYPSGKVRAEHAP